MIFVIIVIFFPMVIVSSVTVEILRHARSIWISFIDQFLVF